MAQLVEEVRQASTLPPRGVARAIRTSAKVSQTRLAAELGVNRMTVARWESGAREPRGALRAEYALLLAALQEAVQS
jgi:DNA-binding transcriptional regulator YiaG